MLGFDFNVEYIATDNLGCADVVSRLISNHQKPEEEYVIATVSLEEDSNAKLKEPVNFKMVRTATKKDAVLQKGMQYSDSSWPNRSRSELENFPFSTRFSVYS